MILMEVIDLEFGEDGWYNQPYPNFTPPLNLLRCAPRSYMKTVTSIERDNCLTKLTEFPSFCSNYFPIMVLHVYWSSKVR